MELLEIVFVFDGRDYRFFYSTIGIGIRIWNFILLIIVHYDFVYYCKNTCVWRSGCWLAKPCMYYVFYWRNTIILSWNFRTISVKNIP